MADLPEDERHALAEARTRLAEERFVSQAESVTDDSRRLLVQLNLMGAEPPAYLKASAQLALRHRLAALAEGTNAQDLLDENSPLEALLEEAHSIGLKPELSLLAPRIAEELRLLVRKARIEEWPEGYERARKVLERRAVLSIDIRAERLQNETWRALEAQGSPIDENLAALAKALGFAVTPSRTG
jgi:hypothetical protein